MKIEYLLNPKTRKSAAHLFFNGDTACSMLSTGGINKDKNKVYSSDMGRKICTMCSTTSRKVLTRLIEKDPAPKPIIGPRNFQVTEAWIRRFRTEGGGWKAVQLNAIGIDWPPHHGWVADTCGTWITQAEKSTFEKYGVNKDPSQKPRIYLSCPYDDRTQAKEMGAKWDADYKCWYISGIEDLTPFMRWIQT